MLEWAKSRARNNYLLARLYKQSFRQLRKTTLTANQIINCWWRMSNKKIVDEEVKYYQQFTILRVGSLIRKMRERKKLQAYNCKKPSRWASASTKLGWTDLKSVSTNLKNVERWLTNVWRVLESITRCLKSDRQMFVTLVYKAWEQ